MAGLGRTPKILKKLILWIERGIIITLIAIMSLLLILATIELVYTVLIAILEPEMDKFIINLDNLLNVFGVFLLVLIGIELLDTIKVYFKENVIHVEVVMLVALIAIARKVIVMDFEEYSGLEVMGIAVVILAISAGYYLIKKTGGSGFFPKEKEEVKDVVIEEKPVSEDSEQVERKKTIKTKIKEKIVNPEEDVESSETQKNIGFKD